ncbi:hypothetical protein [Photobacterium rosenbergii]|uniref:Uncharacterized protein n=1 Tax=Photobacterium rosenbergii TaxID=294936 RepID=A0ABU3ZG84_9GAMM|nr:hypothetical protein [Photobacterium rosenbergii]MDV5168954.1 hypothetical protein [Photobacterium rosenbergii]
MEKYPFAWVIGKAAIVDLVALNQQSVYKCFQLNGLNINATHCDIDLIDCALSFMPVACFYAKGIIIGVIWFDRLIVGG